MSSRRRREKRRRAQLQALYEELSKDLVIDEAVPLPDDVPLLIERTQVEQALYGQSYEEANWAKLSPMFRDAHNRLRQTRGLDPIPPPAIDLYRPPLVKRVDPKEMEALEREANMAKTDFLTGGKKGVGARLMAPGREGFTINGEDVKF